MSILSSRVVQTVSRKPVRIQNRNANLDYLESIIKWNDSVDSTFSLHFDFGKINLDLNNRVVDRSHLYLD